MLSLKFVEKGKKVQPKSYKPKTFACSNKSEKLHISVTFWYIIFHIGFFATFSKDSKSSSNSAFLIILALFKILKTNADETAQKNETTFFYKCGLELNFATIKVWENPVLKSLYPTAHSSLNIVNLYVQGTSWVS
jgi:hypothetical protein